METTEKTETKKWERKIPRKDKTCKRCGEQNDRVLAKDEFACGKFKRHLLK